MGPSEEQSGNVGQKILGDKRAHAVLTEQEIKVLLEECEKQITSPWLLPLVTLALHTGMRQGELLTLKWENIDFDRGSITIIQGKTLRRKTIAINEPAREALEWLQENCYGDLLFLWPWGDPIGKVTVYDAFKRACSAAKIKDFRFHDLETYFYLSSCYGWRRFGHSEGVAWT